MAQFQGTFPIKTILDTIALLKGESPEQKERRDIKKISEYIPKLAEWKHARDVAIADIRQGKPVGQPIGAESLRGGPAPEYGVIRPEGLSPEQQQAAIEQLTLRYNPLPMPEFESALAPQLAQYVLKAQGDPSQDILKFITQGAQSVQESQLVEGRNVNEDVRTLGANLQKYGRPEAMSYLQKVIDEGGNPFTDERITQEMTYALINKKSMESEIQQSAIARHRRPLQGGQGWQGFKPQRVTGTIVDDITQMLKLDLGDSLFETRQIGEYGSKQYVTTMMPEFLPEYRQALDEASEALRTGKVRDTREAYTKIVFPWMAEAYNRSKKQGGGKQTYKSQMKNPHLILKKEALEK